MAVDAVGKVAGEAQRTGQSDRKKTFCLIILDGWGHRENGADNAIFHARKPVWDELMHSTPHTLISGSGLDVGLPEGQMGNSEVGHMSLGAGRIVYQSITRIDKAIRDGDFFTNPAYVKAINAATATGKAVHILGLLSPGGVHSHENHIHAMVELAQQLGAQQIYVHAILDGRDTPPRSAEPSLAAMDTKLRASGKGHIASIIGRYYAMDRDNRWDRVEKAYRMLTEGESDYRARSAVEGLHAAYERDEGDEFVKPTCIPDGDKVISVSDGDALIFMNFRADRAREITRCFVEDDFSGFERRKRPALADFVMTTEYAAELHASCAYPPDSLSNVLGEYLAHKGLTQLRIAETEKYAHVTFFFSGGREALFDGEKRILIPSPDVATYDLQPEMSAPEVTRELTAAIRSGEFDVIICNFANGDMVGHTGVFDAAVKAVETIDHCLGEIITALRDVDGQALITADHGNCEQMTDTESGQPHTAHTTDLVPLIYIGNRKLSLRPQGGRLSDVAPTMLDLMGLDRPAEMDGSTLVE